MSSFLTDVRSTSALQLIAASTASSNSSALESLLGSKVHRSQRVSPGTPATRVSECFPTSAEGAKELR